MHATPINTPRPPGCVRLLAGLAAWLFLTLGLAAQSADTGTINGRVTDAVSKSVLPGAEISVTGSGTRTSSGKDGEFSLKLPAGTYDVTVSYLGQPSKTVSATVTAGTATTLPVVLGDDVVQLDTFKVEGTREGQARAINQQRASQNLVNIISSDLSGQFPDKTIADAVKRLPGITVETDTDTGGSEGRYITIRGMNADFNAVSVNGVRIAVSDFSGLSRRVPLDVVSAKSADQIEVTKALRPDQDGDGIGGAVNIVTRSPFDRDGIYASAEGAVGYSNLSDDYTGNYPHKDLGKEFSASFGTQFGKDNKHGIALSANYRDRDFLKQRVSSTGWRTVASSGAYRPVAIALQHFYDSVTSTGFNGTYEWRPSDENKLRFDFGYSNRDTERGRDRQVYNYTDPVVGTGTIDGDTYSQFTSSTTNTGVSRRVERNVRQFFETQKILSGSLSGDFKVNEWTLTPLLGVSEGKFDGDPDKDISARFRSSRGVLNYTADGYTPVISTTSPVNSPSDYFLNSVDRSTSFVTDTSLAAGLDAKRDTTLFGGNGFWKFGVKGTRLDRNFKNVQNYYFRNAGPDIFANQVLADYNATSTVNGHYNYGFFIDPNKVRDIANTPGALDSPATDNAPRGEAASYKANEDVGAAFGMGQFTWGKLTAISGARIENTETEFKGASAVTDSFGDVQSPTTPYESRRSYVDVLPSIHFRYDQNKNLLFRASVTRSLARPRLADLNPAAFEDRSAGEITVGNLNLKPTRSTNFDLGAEYYFGNASVLSAGLFYKDMTDNTYTTRSPAIVGGTAGTLITRANAESAWVRGFELGYDQQFTFLPAPLDGLGAFANYTYADSEVDTGIAAYQSVKLPLFNQVKHTANIGLFYNKSGIRARAAVIYRSESLTDLSTDGSTGQYDAKLSRYLAPTTTLDLTASYQFAKHWQVFTEFSNVLNEPGRAYDGTKQRIDYNEYTDWSANVGLRWSL